jgi:hypothetical protein
MSSPPLCEPRSPCSRSPCDHAFPVHYRKPRDQAVGAVVTVDPEEVVRTAVPRVSADERLEPHLARDRPDEVPIEVKPTGLSPPALLLAESEMDIRRDADETEHSRVEAELLLDDTCPVRQQRLLDCLACESAAAGKLEEPAFRTRMASFESCIAFDLGNSNSRTERDRDGLDVPSG